MAAERPELRLIRESLEAVLSPSIVSSVVFEALEQTGGLLPAGTDGARTFVGGPLRESLGRRLGADADPIIDDVVLMLSAVAPRPPTPSGSIARPPTASPASRRDLDITVELQLDTRPVLVLVVAAVDHFALRLEGALGPARVSAHTMVSLQQFEEQLRRTPPQVVLVDAADFASIEPGALAQALERLPPSAVRAIWGADLPFGAALMRALVERRVPSTPFDRREGIDPLLDLIRSRRAS